MGDLYGSKSSYKYFLTIVEEALLLPLDHVVYVTDPPLSQQLKSWRKNLMLFYSRRDSRNLQLTAVARCLQTDARRLLALSNVIQKKLWIFPAVIREIYTLA